MFYIASKVATNQSMKRERNAGYFSEIDLLSIQNNQTVFNIYTPDIGKRATSEGRI